MYPEEGKRLNQAKHEVDESDLNFCHLSDIPLPPPRHKQDSEKTSNNFNLIEL